jgi:1-acyl-sn-glycerol-3-phosphate acyltransferase
VQKIIVFNHPSWVDSIILLYLFAPSGVSREANLHIPLIGRIIWSFQNIYVPAKQPVRQQASEALEAPLVQPATQTTTQQIAQRCAHC